MLRRKRPAAAGLWIYRAEGGTPWAGGDGQRCFGKVLPIPQTLVVISKMRYAVRKSKLGLELKLKQVQCGIV